MNVSATCNWTGHVTVSWSTREGIKLYYNCTGAVPKSVSVHVCVHVCVYVCVCL